MSELSSQPSSKLSISELSIAPGALPHCDSITVCLDISGSTHGEEKLMAQVAALVASYGRGQSYKFRIIYFDDQVQKVETFESASEAEVYEKIFGYTSTVWGGGSVITEALEEALNQNTGVTWIVVVTDGELYLDGSEPLAQRYIGARAAGEIKACCAMVQTLGTSDPHFRRTTARCVSSGLFDRVIEIPQSYVPAIDELFQSLSGSPTPAQLPPSA